MHHIKRRQGVLAGLYRNGAAIFCGQEKLGEGSIFKSGVGTHSAGPLGQGGRGHALDEVANQPVTG